MSAAKLVAEMAVVDALLRETWSEGEALFSVDLAAKRQEGLSIYIAFLSRRLVTPYGRAWAELADLMARVADVYAVAEPSDRLTLRQAVQRPTFQGSLCIVANYQRAQHIQPNARPRRASASTKARRLS